MRLDRTWLLVGASALALAATASLAGGCAEVLGIEEITPQASGGGTTTGGTGGTAGTGGSGAAASGGNGTGGVGGPCSPDDPATCDDSNRCTTDSCDADEQCQHEDLDGVAAPGATQPPGDCSTIMCVGGQEQTVDEPTDVPVDGNPCTQDVCAGGTPSNPNEPQGTSCPAGECDGDGNCAMVCGQQPPGAGGPCPPECTDCQAGVCTIACNASTCSNATVACPAGWPCRVQCGSNDSCNQAIIVCPDVHACEVNCSDTQACGDAVIECSTTGTCEINCSSTWQTCQGADMNCGENSCTASCQSMLFEQPTLHCGSSCDCQPC